MKTSAPIAILHGVVSPNAPPAEQDTMTQVCEVASGLAALGRSAVPTPVSLNLQSLRETLLALQPGVVFNLVESIAGQDALLPLAPLVVEDLGLPCTGASAVALTVTGDKVTAKAALHRARIPTPEIWTGAARNLNGTWIVKSVTQQASFGLDDGAVVTADGVKARLLASRTRHGGEWFAERYVPGREFNLSMLETEMGVEVLAPAEIQFFGYPEDKPRIVGHAAKWEPEAPEYGNTPRRFDFPAEDRPLLKRLQRLALRCWSVFALTGYARVDIRVDPAGRPWVLEINANPCLAKDAGFVAAALRTGRTYEHLLTTLLSTAERHARSKVRVAPPFHGPGTPSRPDRATASVS